MRVAGEEYDVAASVLLDIDFDYLMLWGHARLVADMHQRLQNRLTDQTLLLGSLNNSGVCYSNMGDYARASDLHQQQLAIARKIGDRYGESNALINLGDIYRDAGKLAQAYQCYQDAIFVADKIGNKQNQHEAYFGVALEHLFAGDLPAARQAIEVARGHDFPENNAAAWTVTGIIQLRQEEQAAARDSFSQGLAETNKLLEKSAQHFAALDTKALALCGLALSEDQRHVTTATDAFRTARKITKAKGVVARVLKQFDALAQADSNDILTSLLRKTAAGE